MFTKTGLKKFFASFMSLLVAVTCMMPVGGVQAWAEDGTIVINDTNLSPNVNVYLDSNHTIAVNPNGQEIVPTDDLFGVWSVAFTGDVKPTAANSRVVYNLPEGITIKNTWSNRELYDDDTNELAGTYSLVQNSDGSYSIVLEYSESYLAGHEDNIQAHVDFSFNLNADESKEGDSKSISFPGTSTPFTFNIGDSGVTGSKGTGSYDPATGKITWTVTLNPGANTDNLTVTDTAGSNLSFDADSFKLDGDAVTTTPTVDGNTNTATISLGSVSKGEHKLTYTTSIKSEALEGLANGVAVSNVDNQVKWSWGNEPNKHNSEVTTANGPSVKYDMVSSKSAANDSTSDNIKWTVTVNNGDLKANMAGYVFTDALQDATQQEYTGSYVVKDASGAQVDTGILDSTKGTFSYTFGDTATAQKYTIEYSTKFKEGTSATATVKNDATVEKEGELSDTATGQFTGTDTTTYLTKELTDDSQKNSGVAQWKSTITSSAMAAGTTSLVYTDHLQTVSGAETTYGGITVKVAGGDALTEGTDYTVTQGKEATWYNYSTLTITFTAGGLAKFMGTSDVEVSYTTTTTDTVNGTYTNYASIKDTNWSANASYIVDSNAPALEKPEGKVAWDDSYTWEDGTKGAWITTWTVIANHAGNNTQGANLAGKTISITDDLAGMDYVADSASIKLTNNNNSGDGISDWTAKSVTPTIDDNGKATFTWEVAGYSGSAYHDCVTLEYKTAIKASDSKLPAAETTMFTNKASGSAGDIAFPEGTGTTSINNQVLSKDGAYDEGTNTAKYTVDINKAALDLDANSDTLTLTDTLSAEGTFLPSTLKVVDADTGAAVTFDVKVVDTEDGKTQVTLVIPDAQHLTVTYSVRPNASTGENVTISNSVEFAGMTSSSTGKDLSFMVAKASGGTSGDASNIVVTKYSSESIGELLPGAIFTLYKVDLDTGNETQVTTATSNKSGVATFEGVDSDVLYAIRETTAPTGYKKSDKVSYVVRRAKDAAGNFTDEETYQNIVTKAKALNIESISTNLATSFYDDKEDTEEQTTTATIRVSKEINGANPTPDEQFTFDLYKDDEKVDSVSVKGGESAEYKTLTFKEEGTFTYTIKETAKLGWTNETGDVTATVKVTKNQETGNLEATVEYSSATEDKSSALFTNKYTAEDATATIKVSKEINGANPTPDEQFTFDLYKDDEKVDSVSVKGGESAEYKTLTFKEEGTFTYTIKETAKLGWTNETGDVTATVKVTKNQETGNLEATVEYSNSTTAKDSALFVNAYKTTDITIKVNKKVHGDNAKADEKFTFELQDKGGNKLETIELKADETKEFTTFKKGVGTYEYNIHETSENGEGWTNDQDIKLVVEVTEGEDGKLQVKYTYTKDSDGSTSNEAAFFVDEYKKPEDETPKKKEEKKQSKKALAQTGDNTPLTFMAGLGAAGLTAVAASLAVRRRNSKRN